MYNYALCICPFCKIIENYRDKSDTSRFYSKISVYFVTVIIKCLVWQAVSSASGSLVQKVGGGGNAHPAPKLGRAVPRPHRLPRPCCGVSSPCSSLTFGFLGALLDMGYVSIQYPCSLASGPIPVMSGYRWTFFWIHKVSGT